MGRKSWQRGKTAREEKLAGKKKLTGRKGWKRGRNDGGKADGREN